MAFGTKPFSNVGYQIESDVDIEGSTETKSVYIEGDGGLYSIYWSNAFLLNKYLSLGINSMYISGNIKQTENQTDYLFEKSSRTSQLYNTFGLQFHNGPWVAGLTYGYKQKLTMENSTVIYNSSNTEIWTPKIAGLLPSLSLKPLVPDCHGRKEYRFSYGL